MVLVTGATGFVGRALVKALVKRGDWPVRSAVRNGGHDLTGLGQGIFMTDIASGSDWTQGLIGVNVVVHTAARVHIQREQVANPLAAFRKINVQGTLALASQAAAAGVRRFVFLSSVKVNGEETAPRRPFTEDDVPAPRDPYGTSKMEAEAGLQQIAAETGMELVIIRPPLVYGPGVGANFKALMHAVARGMPLPLAQLDNRRSLVALDNLLDFIVVCMGHPGAANETFLVSDGEDLSTPELIRRMALALERPARLFPVPLGLLRAGASMLGKRDTLQRLAGNLQVSIQKAANLLGWSPAAIMDQVLRRTAKEWNP